MLLRGIFGFESRKAEPTELPGTLLSNAKQRKRAFHFLLRIDTKISRSISRIMFIRSCTTIRNICKSEMARTLTAYMYDTNISESEVFLR